MPAKYILERDIRPPHLDKPRKVCDSCGNEKDNNFIEFQRVPFRTQRFGPRHTTGPTCKLCYASAIRKAARARHAIVEDAEKLAAEDAANGTYLGAKKP